VNGTKIEQVSAAVARFTDWLARYGEVSWDHQSYFASDRGRAAKALYYRKPMLGTLAVAPMIFSEAFLPSARKLFWKAQRFPIADAHYSMGFSFLFKADGREEDYTRAVHFLDVLKQTRCPAYQNYCWGYPFNWETRKGTIKEATPLITTVPYAYEAFRLAYEIDGKSEWREIMHSIAEHALLDYRDVPTSSSAAACSYSPSTEAVNSVGVVNASAYRGCMLTMAAADFEDERYRKAAEGNLNFVIESQSENGSWPYSMDAERGFVDHFHTCFVLKALAKTERITATPKLSAAIARGVEYYVNNLFGAEELPLPFSKRPRMTVYKRELYDYAECVNVGVLLAKRFPKLDQRVAGTLNDLLERWQKRDGSFRARQLMLGWDNVPMHRWAQSQLFRSFCFLIASQKNSSNGRTIAQGRLQESAVSR
jgi:hypothetical protein